MQSLVEEGPVKEKGRCKDKEAYSRKETDHLVRVLVPPTQIYEYVFFFIPW